VCPSAVSHHANTQNSTLPCKAHISIPRTSLQPPHAQARVSVSFAELVAAHCHAVHTSPYHVHRCSLPTRKQGFPSLSQSLSLHTAMQFTHHHTTYIAAASPRASKGSRLFHRACRFYSLVFAAPRWTPDNSSTHAHSLTHSFTRTSGTLGNQYSWHQHTHSDVPPPPSPPGDTSSSHSQSSIASSSS
jgi:hypothetical protein